MIKFENITKDILRLKVPFGAIYTAVFLIKTEGGAVLADAAATESDALDIILPAIKECISPDEIKYLICTHLHGDHGGGIKYILPHLKNAKVAVAAAVRAGELYGEENVLALHDGDSLLGLDILRLPGHSRDSLGVFDSRTKTLISGDAVQLYGIMKYGCGVELPTEYRNTLERLNRLDISQIIASHEYYPLGAIAEENGVTDYLSTASRAYERIAAFVNENKNIGDAVAIAKAFTEEARKAEPQMPSLQSYTVKSLLKLS